MRVGEPCIAFLQKMPKCQTNKNQKTKKKEIKTFFHTKYLLYAFFYVFFSYKNILLQVIS